jgi:hypothetical protein
VACADTSGQVLLYGFLPHKGAYYKWDLVGKAKAHHGELPSSAKLAVVPLQTQFTVLWPWGPFVWLWRVQWHAACTQGMLLVLLALQHGACSMLSSTGS